MGAGRPDRRGLRRQGGWVGLVMLLLALVIAGWLARIALRQRAPPEPAVGTTAPATASGNAVRRARDVEVEVAKQAEGMTR